MLSDYQIDAAHAMAARGLGHEDISVKLSVKTARGRAQVRRIVLRKGRPTTPIFKLFSDARGRQNAKPRLRERQAASVANRDVPITLPPISILGDDQ